MTRRVTVISDYALPSVGGIESHVRVLLENLPKHGVVPTLITRKIPWKENPSSLSWIQLPSLLSKYNPISLGYDFALPDPLFISMLMAKHLLAEGRLVHTHGLTTLSVAATRIHTYFPLLTTVHNYWPFCPRGTLVKHDGTRCDGRTDCCLDCLREDYGVLSMIIPAVQGLNRFLLDEVDEFICVSKFVADSLVRAGFPRKRTSVVYNWVDIGMSEALGNAHRNPSECRDFLFVGNLGRIKGVLSLLRAVDLLGNSISGRKVDIIGSGSDYPLLRRFALKSGIMSRIRFVGSVSNQELVRAYNSSRAVICPSEWHEPCPTVVLEAMAMGRPVIATKVGGIPELVENTMTGLLVDPSSPDQLASAIRLLSEGDAQVDRMGELGYRRAKTKFGIASNMDVILRKYEKYQTNENPTLPTGATV